MSQPLAGRTIVYLGPDSPHADALEAFGHRTGAAVHRLPDSAWAGCYRPAGRIGQVTARARRVACQVFGRIPARFLQDTLDQLDRLRPDVVLGYWGINPLGDLWAIRRSRPSLPVVCVMLCHPQALTRRRVGVQNWLLRRAAPHLNGVIFPSLQMQQYVTRVVGRPLPSAVLPPFWPSAWQSASKAPPAGLASPAVIFLGRMESNQRCDDVRTFLTALTRAKIHVYHVGPRVESPEPYRHTFPATTVPEIMAFSRHFDASLIVYNLDDCEDQERFRNTVPDRMISSVCAGVPVALPRTGYDACSAYVRDYPHVYRFDTPDDLAEQLKAKCASPRPVEPVPGPVNWAAEATDAAWVAFLEGLFVNRRGGGFK